MIKLLRIILVLCLVLLQFGIASAKSYKTSARLALEYDIENLNNVTSGQIIHATMAFRPTSDLEYLSYKIDHVKNASIENNEPVEFKNISKNDVIKIKFTISVTETPCSFTIFYGTSTKTMSGSGVESVVIGSKHN